MSLFRTARGALLITGAAAAIGLAGCGGGPANTPAGGGPGASAAGASTPAASGGGLSDASQPVATSTGGGGGGVGVCDLVTKAELEAALGLSPVVTTVVAGPPDTCDIKVDDAPTAAIVYTNAGAKTIFQVLALGADAHAVSGIGDQAFYSDETMYFVVLKGDAMISISVVDSNLTADQQAAAREAIARAAAPRM